MRRSALGTVFASALSLSLVARSANAQEANDKAAAEVLFEQGRALLLEGKVEEACPKLSESLRLDRGIGTMLFLAECWQRMGKTASAWAQFREAETIAANEKDAREKVARDRAEKLVPLLSTIVIRVPPEAKVPGLVVQRDGREVGEAVWGTKTPIDPGPHVIAASAPGYKAWEAKVTIDANADQGAVTIPILEKAPVAPPPPANEAPPSSGTFQKGLGLGLAGVGVIGVAVGTAFGLSAIKKNDRADAHCPSTCDAEGIAIGERANDHGNISTIGFIAGAVLIAGGAVLFFTAGPSAKSTNAGVRRHGAGFAF